MLKNTRCMVIVLLVILLSTVAMASEKPAGTLVKINETYITEKDMELDLKDYLTYFQTKENVDFTTPEGKEILVRTKQFLLEKYIRKAMVFQALAEYNLAIPAGEIEKEIEKFKETDSENLELHRQDAELILAYRILIDYLTKDYQITEEELHRFYQANLTLFNEPETAEVSHIQLDSREKAEEIYLQLMLGSDFASLAKEYSLCSSAVDGGQMGVVQRDKIIKEINDVVFTLKVGEVSKPVESRFGWHIFKVTGKTPEVPHSFEESRNQVEEIFIGTMRTKVLEKFLAEKLALAEIEYFLDFEFDLKAKVLQGK